MMIDREATGPGALGEEDPLLNVRIEGELERNGPREDLAGVREGGLLWVPCHRLQFRLGV